MFAYLKWVVWTTHYRSQGMFDVQIYDKWYIIGKVVCKKFAIFFRKTCAIRFLLSKAFQKVKFYQNLTRGSGSKQRFSVLKEKTVIQAVCLRTQELVLKPGFRPKGRALGM